MVIIISGYVTFVSSSSILLEKTDHASLLIIVGILFILSIIAEKWSPRIRLLQIVLLCLFHWFSQLNWCLPLYLLLAVNQFYYIGKLNISILVALLFGSLYTIVRLSYTPTQLYTLLVIVSDLLSFVAVTILFFYILHTEREKNASVNKANI